jgi:hypothetical protein
MRQGVGALLRGSSSFMLRTLTGSASCAQYFLRYHRRLLFADPQAFLNHRAGCTAKSGRQKPEHWASHTICPLARQGVLLQKLLLRLNLKTEY